MHRLYILFLFTLFFLSTFNGICQQVFKQKDGTKLELLENGDATYYDKKGNLIGEGKLKNLKKNGTWKYYKEKGKLYAIENYKMHELEGQATYYYPGTTQLKATGIYKEGKRDGEWKFYAYNRGLLYNSVTYSGGKVHGPAVYYDTVFAGHKIGEGKHYEGKRTGEWTFYAHCTGKMHGIEHYENGLMEGPATYFDTINTCDGPVCTKIADGQYEKNLRTGIWTFYYTPSGKIYARQTYEDSILNGPAKYYYESTGKLASEGNYKMAVNDGQWNYYDSATGWKGFGIGYDEGEDTTVYEYFYDERAVIKSIQRSKKGLLHGDYEFFDSLTGMPTEVKHYDLDIRTGYTSYYNGIKTFSSTTYNGDSCHTISYDSTCNYIISEGFFKDNKQKEGYIKYYFTCSDKLSALQSVIKNYQYVKFFDSSYGTIKAEGQGTKDKRYGEWKYYYPNSQQLYATLTYKNDVVEGPGRYYDSLSGKVLMEGSFKQGNRDGKWVAYNRRTGKPVTEEAYKSGELQGKQVIYDTTGNIFYSYNYKNGVKNGEGLMNYYGSSIRWIDFNYKNDSLHGTLRSYYRNGKLKREEKYGNGNLISATCYTPDGDTTEYYPIIIQPQFEEDVMNYIGRNLQYPQEAKENKTEGKVVVRFKIHETGMVSDAEIIKSAGHGMDEEALRLITRMPPWEPAYFDGIPFETYKTLPIVFWLHDDMK